MFVEIFSLDSGRSLLSETIHNIGISALTLQALQEVDKQLHIITADTAGVTKAYQLKQDSDDKLVLSCTYETEHLADLNCRPIVSVAVNGELTVYSFN